MEGGRGRSHDAVNDGARVRHSQVESATTASWARIVERTEGKTRMRRWGRGDDVSPGGRSLEERRCQRRMDTHTHRKKDVRT